MQYIARTQAVRATGNSLSAVKFEVQSLRFDVQNQIEMANSQGQAIREDGTLIFLARGRRCPKDGIENSVLLWLI
jgi:hypothetical protein